MRFFLFFLSSVFIHGLLFASINLFDRPIFDDQIVSIGTWLETSNVAAKKASSNQNRKRDQAVSKTVSDQTEKQIKNQNQSVSGSDLNSINDSNSQAGSEGVLDRAPQVIKETKAIYPKAAQKMGIEGVVEMNVRISATGQVEEVQLIRGPGYGLNESAVEAMKAFVFSPAIKNKENVATEIIYKYRFVLGGS